MERQAIKIAYPSERLADRRMVLFCSLDEWKSPIEAAGFEDGVFLFEFQTNEPFFHFKPALLDQEGVAAWSVGSDYLAPLPEERLIFPSFESSPQGAILDRQELKARDGESYGFRVYLPPGYEENTSKRYPVCFMHDGHNLFFPEEAFGGQTWQVQRTLELLDKMNSIEPCVVVALYPNDRFKDYTQPGCARYARFLTGKLLPHLEKTYRLLSGPEHRLVMGSSLGGLVSFYLAWHHSNVFGRAACLSSTFGFDYKLLNTVKRSRRVPNIKVYLDSGWPGDNFAETQAMAHIMLSKGFRLGLDMHYLAVPEAQHNESAWAQRLHLPFQFLLGLSYGQNTVIDLPQAA